MPFGINYQDFTLQNILQNIIKLYSNLTVTSIFKIKEGIFKIIKDINDVKIIIEDKEIFLSQFVSDNAIENIAKILTSEVEKISKLNTQNLDFNKERIQKVINILINIEHMITSLYCKHLLNQKSYNCLDQAYTKLNVSLLRTPLEKHDGIFQELKNWNYDESLLINENNQNQKIILINKLLADSDCNIQCLKFKKSDKFTTIKNHIGVKEIF